ncbi:MAG TPA: acetyl-CoA synthetase [Candidatus Woesearchaeota archaeon]|nr:acetyl-CoA synthetase [Candidatus Woesearchaeota archaeon]
MGKLSDSLKLLEKNEFIVPRYGIARTINDAFSIADEIGYPVVLKINSDSHKTDFGGVVTNIQNAVHLKKVWEDFMEKTKKLPIVFEDYIVQKQISGVEFILGAKEDPVFGKVIMVGSGGILAEILNDVSFRAVPIDAKDAESMISEIKASQLLSGFRGKKFIRDIKLIETLIKLSVFVQKNDFAEMDMNPVIINNDNAWVVDARMR